MARSDYQENVSRKINANLTIALIIPTLNEAEPLPIISKQIDRTLFDSKTYDEPGMKLTVSELMKVRSKVERELVEAEALWVEVNEELERFEVNPI